MECSSNDRGGTRELDQSVCVCKRDTQSDLGNQAVRRAKREESGGYLPGKFTPPRAVWFCSGALSVREEEEWKRERRRGECVVEEPSQLLRAAHAVGNRMSVSTLSPASSTL